MKKNIVVTGGNRGIGKAIVEELAKLRHHVIIAARNEKTGKALEKQLVDTGYDARFLQLDQSKPEEIERFAKLLYSDYDRLDVLINNAAVFLDNGQSSTKVKMKDIKRTIDINLYGPIDLSKTLLNLLKGSTEGRIINVTSGLGAMNEMSGNHTGYRLSKVALNAFTQIFASDLRDTTIKVNSMCPGWVKTDMGGEGAPRSVDQGADTAVWLATAEMIPNGKFLRDRTEIEW